MSDARWVSWGKSRGSKDRCILCGGQTTARAKIAIGPYRDYRDVPVCEFDRFNKQRVLDTAT